MKQWQKWTILIVCCLLCVVIPFAADGKTLSQKDLQYQEPQSAAAPSLFLAAVKVIFSLGLVVSLAYLLSKFFGGKMAGLVQGNKLHILDSLPLGPNKVIHIVEIADEVFVLGVTDHNINVISKVEDPEIIETLKQEVRVMPGKDSLTSYLQQFRDRFRRGDHHDPSSNMLLQEQIERLRNLTKRTAKNDAWRKQQGTGKSEDENNDL